MWRQKNQLEVGVCSMGDLFLKKKMGGENQLLENYPYAYHSKHTVKSFSLTHNNIIIISKAEVLANTCKWINKNKNVDI